MTSLNGITAETGRRKAPGGKGATVYRTELYAYGPDGPVRIAQWRQDEGLKSGTLFMEKGFSEEKLRDAICCFGTHFFSDNMYMLSCFAEYERMWRIGVKDGFPVLLVAEAGADYIGRFARAGEAHDDPWEVMSEERHELELKHPREEVRVRAFAFPDDFILGDMAYDAADLVEDGEDG